MPETITTKRCPTCKDTLPVSLFWKNSTKKDGRASCCKSCENERKKRYLKTEKGQAMQRAAEKKYGRSEKGRATNRRWQHTEKGRVASMVALWKFPDRRRARSAVSSAVRAGRLPKIKTQNCVDCGLPAAHYHHVLGYEPEHHLDVVPLCRLCDANRHCTVTTS